jgi:hypothetical protein
MISKIPAAVARAIAPAAALAAAFAVRLLTDRQIAELRAQHDQDEILRLRADNERLLRQIEPVTQVFELAREFGRREGYDEARRHMFRGDKVPPLEPKQLGQAASSG